MIVEIAASHYNLPTYPSLWLKIALYVSPFGSSFLSFYKDGKMKLYIAYLAEWSKALDLRSIVHLCAEVRTLQYAFWS